MTETLEADHENAPTRRTFVLPLILVVIGVAFVIYAVLFNARTVFGLPPAAGTEEISSAIVSGISTAPVVTPSPSTTSALTPAAAPSTDSVLMSEPAMVLEVTVGGLTLAASGEIRRTYVGAPPAACPT